ncbi:MAG: tetratricopeptide repeat protein [Acidimicrobiales bacterium]
MADGAERGDELVEGWRQLAALRASGDDTGALQAVRRMAGAFPDAVDVQTARAELELAVGDPAAAKQAATVAAGLAPERPGPHRLRAESLLALGRADEAADAAELADACAPYDVANATLVARAAGAAGRCGQARAAAMRALELDPNGAAAWEAAGAVALYDDDAVEAERRYRGALLRGPGRPTAMRGLAEAAAAQGRDDEATELRAEADRIDPPTERSPAADVEPEPEDPRVVLHRFVKERDARWKAETRMAIVVALALFVFVVLLFRGWHSSAPDSDHAPTTCLTTAIDLSGKRVAYPC